MLRPTEHPLSCFAFLAPPHGCAAVLQQERVIELKQQANTAALIASRCFAELGKQQSTSGQILPLRLLQSMPATLFTRSNLPSCCTGRV